MRLLISSAMAAVIFAATAPAWAQSSDLNSINSSLSAQAQSRAAQQQQTTQMDRSLMQSERDQSLQQPAQNDYIINRQMHAMHHR